jgi:periplasmic protein TonB
MIWNNGWFDEMGHYLNKHIRYPREAKKNGIEGQVKIRFDVDTLGNLSNFEIEEGLGYGCDEEVIRVLKKGPKWTPASVDGQLFEMSLAIPVKFRLP